MTRTVFAVDVTTTMISMARFQETSDGTAAKPDLALVQPTLAAHFSPYSEWHHATACANQVVGKILKGGKPDLVVLATSFWGATATDSSANRRFRILHAIEDALFTAGVTVAEFPFTTASRWLMGYTPRSGKSGAMTELEKAVQSEWNVQKPSYTTKSGDQRKYPYRSQVVALAAVGAMAVGIPTSVEVTDARLEILAGAGNGAVSWPKDIKLPKTIEKWQELNASPNLLRAS